MEKIQAKRFSHVQKNNSCIFSDRNHTNNVSNEQPTQRKRDYMANAKRIARWDSRTLRQVEAKQRQEIASKRTPSQQLAIVQQRNASLKAQGLPCAAKKETAKLQTRIAAQ